MKAAKLAEDKKSTQKSLESSLSKKPLETIKKAKKEKRDGSTDSEDSDDEGKTYFKYQMCSTYQLVVSFTIFISQVRENPGS